MAKTYSAYTVNFLEKSADQGLRYSVSRLFSVLPSGIGHIIDTLLGLDGLFFESDSHFSGPFGFLLGIIPLLLGLILGQILQLALNVFSYLGYYLLDFPLRLVIRDFHKVMVEVWLLNLISSLLIKFTEATPTQMQGLFGFTLGFWPHIARHLINRIGATFTSIVDFIVDNICDGIRFMYLTVSQELLGEKSLDNKPSQAKESKKTSQAPPKVSRIKRPVETKEIDEITEEALKKVYDNKIDLFAVLGITLADYETDAKIITMQFRKLGVSCHPDKVTDENLKAQAKTQWQLIGWAKEILQDPHSDMARKYVYRYKQGGMAQQPAPGMSSATILSPVQPAADWRNQGANTSLGTDPNSFHKAATSPVAPSGKGPRLKRPTQPNP
jgi:hypothetical protein